VSLQLAAEPVRTPKRRMRHVTCYDAALAAVRTLTENDPTRVFTVDEVESLIRAAAHDWPRATIVKIVKRDLAGIGSGGNAPRSVPVLERLPGGGFRLR
jgi:hypothetical protein